MGGVLWTLLVDYLLASEDSAQLTFDERAGVPHLVKCGGSVLNTLHLGSAAAPWQNPPAELLPRSRARFV